MNPEFLPAMAAIYQGDTDELRRLVAADPTLATRKSTCSHPTLLQMVAVEAGLGRVPAPVEAARVLVEAGSPLQEPLVAAASTDARDVLRYLLSCGAALSFGDWKPLDEALYWSHIELSRELVQRGAPVDSLRVAAGLGAVDAMAAFVTANGPVPGAGPVGSPFQDTLPEECVNDPQQVLDNALITAVLNDQLDAARWLVARGADVNGKPCGFHWRGSALHAAVWRNATDTIDWLLQEGADRTLCDDAHGGDAVGWAEHNGHVELAQRLRAI